MTKLVRFRLSPHGKQDAVYVKTRFCPPPSAQPGCGTLDPSVNSCVNNNDNKLYYA